MPKNFYDDFKTRESSNNPRAKSSKSSYYHIGLYQFGKAALVDAGYYNTKPLKARQKPGDQYNNG